MERKRHALRVEDFHPLHYAILQTLPQEGSVLGYRKLTLSARQITRELNKSVSADQRLSSSEVAAALISLRFGGYVVSLRTARSGSAQGWQRTAKGLQALPQEGSA